ncbi:MAG: hypothetical protein QOH43_2068 [Solirubrobacteraceae bacterium]|jgi:hypothetical protein|nr:hypothetical protein [Solirubrobacteraceae bacterium]
MAQVARQMKVQSIRFSDELWRLIQQEAEFEGISASQFIRETVIFQIGYRLGQRGVDLHDSAQELGITELRRPARED